MQKQSTIKQTSLIFSRSLRLLIVVLIPAALVVAYIFFIASERYQSESSVIIRDTGQTQASEIDLSTLFASAGTSKQDSLLLAAYIRSQNMLTHLDQTLELRSHYSSIDRDFISRLNSDASAEDFLLYYQDRLSVKFDDQSSVLTIRIQAFDPAFAMQISSEILKKSESFINDIGRQMAAEQVQFFYAEAENAAGKLANKRDQVLKFQDDNDVLNPQQQGESLTGIVTQLEIELAQARTLLKAQLGFLREGAAEVVATRNRIRALQSQIASEQRRLLGSKESGVNLMMAKFQDLNTQFELASEVYRSTLAALQQAQFDAGRKLKHLIRISGPTEPDSAAFPRRGYIMATLALALIIFYGIVSMLIAILREHAE